jgi:hypothetical protein
VHSIELSVMNVNSGIKLCQSDNYILYSTVRNNQLSVSQKVRIELIDYLLKPSSFL